MKKRILSVLIALVMLIGLITVMSISASAESAPEEHTIHDGWTNIAIYEDYVDWFYFDTPSEVYKCYLDQDYDNTRYLYVGQNCTVYLCLNGKTLAPNSNIQLEEGATLHICDCSSTAGKIDGKNHNAFHLGTNSTLYLHNGEITCNMEDPNLATVLLAGNNSHFIMNGGSVSNTASSGGIAVMNKYSGGSYNTAQFTMNGGTVIGSSSNRAPLMINPSFTFNMNGGKIENTSQGTNIPSVDFVGGTINLSGTVDLDLIKFTNSGQTINIRDGGFNLADPSKKITLHFYSSSGGEYYKSNPITSGWGTNMAGAHPASYFTVRDLYSNVLYADLNANGEVVATATKPEINYTITASTDPTEGGTVTGGGTYKDGTSVTLTATANRGYKFVRWTKGGVEVSTNATYTFTATEAAEYVANFVDTHTHCICGTTHTNVGNHNAEDEKTFNAISTYDELVTAATNGGSVYLANDIELTSTITVAEGKIFNLCLNGMKLYYAGSGNVSIFTVEEDATLNITDCGTTARAGYVEVDGDGDTLLWHEGTVYGTDDIPYDLIGGLITGGTGTVGESVATRFGGAVYAQTGATVNLYGGNIAGNSADYGGGIYGEGCTMNIYGGSIVGNIIGGIELVCNNRDQQNIIDSSLKIHGGNIKYNTNHGYSASEVDVSGTITMTGGTVIAKNSHIAIAGTDDFTMSGGTVTNAAENGLGIHVAGTGVLSGGKVAAPNNGIAVSCMPDEPVGCFDNSSIHLSGAPVLEGGSADIVLARFKYSDDSYSCDTRHIVLDGPLTGTDPYTVTVALVTYELDEDSFVIAENPTIDFTKGWSTHMGDANPAAYFNNANSAVGAKQIALVDGELWLATTYTVTTEDTNGETRGGSYSVNKTTAIAGETVTITLTPDEGYILNDIRVYSGVSDRVMTTRVNDTTYTFVMPNLNVSVGIKYMMPNLSVTCGNVTKYAENLKRAFEEAEALSNQYDGAPVTIKVERDYTEDIRWFNNDQLEIESYSSTPDIILDLNGKDIHFPETTRYLADIGMLLITGYDLTLTDTSSEGDGIIHALVNVDGRNGNQPCAIEEEGAEIDYDLIVEGGTYRGFMVYTSDKIKISGGTFLGMPQEVIDEMLEDYIFTSWATFIGTKGLLISNNGGFASEAEARAALNAIIADGYATHKDYEITAFSYTGDETDTKYYAGFAANTVVGRSITKEETNNGSFDVKVGEDEVNAAVAGTTVTITATPAEGCEVDSITVVGAGDVTVDVNSDGTFTMPDNAITITVTFKKQIFTVTTVVTTGGTVAGAGAYEHGSVATLAAMPNSGCVFMGWFTDDTYQTPFDPTTPITENITVYAKFVDYEGDKKALQEAIGALEEDVTELNKLIETNGTIDQINDKLAEIQNKINLLGNTYATDAEVADAITAAKNEVIAAYRQALNNAVVTLENKIEEKIDPNELAVEIERVTALINALNNTYATDEETADALEAAIAEAQAAIATAYEQAIADAVERLEEADRNNASALDKAIDDLEALIGLAENAAAAGDQTLSGQIANAILKAETELTSAKGDLEALIGDVQSNLDQIETDLAQAIRELREAIDQDTSGLSSRISSLSLSIQSAKSQLAAADAENKAELVSKIETADATLDAAIKAVQKNLDDAKAELGKAIADGDTALDTKITNLNTALNDAVAALEQADTDNKAELVKKIEEADASLQAAIDKVTSDLAKAQKDLADAIATGDASLSSRISSVSASLSAAKSALEKADADNKAALEAKIEAAEATLDAAIKAVQKNLDDAKAELNKAIADGDTALDDKISALNEALTTAKAALEATDSANKSELTSKIDEADAALQAAIDALSTELNATNEKVAELETFIIIVCVISGVAFSGCAALAVLYVLGKKKKI